VKKLEILRRFWGLMGDQLFSTTPGNEGFQVFAERILFLAANPKNSSQLRLDEEIREIHTKDPSGRVPRLLRAGVPLGRPASGPASGVQ
jgi:hypothetical protein